MLQKSTQASGNVATKKGFLIGFPWSKKKITTPDKINCFYVLLNGVSWCITTFNVDWYYSIQSP